MRHFYDFIAFDLRGRLMDATNPNKRRVRDTIKKSEPVKTSTRSSRDKKKMKRLPSSSESESEVDDHATSFDPNDLIITPDIPEERQPSQQDDRQINYKTERISNHEDSNGDCLSDANYPGMNENLKTKIN
jgi:hypothetical protein